MYRVGSWKVGGTPNTSLNIDRIFFKYIYLKKILILAWGRNLRRPQQYANCKVLLDVYKFVLLLCTVRKRIFQQTVFYFTHTVTQHCDLDMKQMNFEFESESYVKWEFQ